MKRAAKVRRGGGGGEPCVLGISGPPGPGVLLTLRIPAGHDMAAPPGEGCGYTVRAGGVVWRAMPVTRRQRRDGSVTLTVAIEGQYPDSA
jgi:hypothetical protein